MSFVGRWWRALNTEYDIGDTWLVTFLTLTLTLALSIPSLLYYTYAWDERADTQSYYSFHYSSHWYYLAATQLHSLHPMRIDSRWRQKDSSGCQWISTTFCGATICSCLGVLDTSWLI